MKCHKSKQFSLNDNESEVTARRIVDCFWGSVERCLSRIRCRCFEAAIRAFEDICGSRDRFPFGYGRTRQYSFSSWCVCSSARQSRVPTRSGHIAPKIGPSLSRSSRRPSAKHVRCRRLPVCPSGPGSCPALQFRELEKVEPSWHKQIKLAIKFKTIQCINPVDSKLQHSCFVKQFSDCHQTWIGLFIPVVS